MTSIDCRTVLDGPLLNFTEVVVWHGWWTIIRVGFGWEQSDDG